MDAAQLLQKPIVRSREEISSLIRKWLASGKTKTTFCRENNLTYMTFIRWTRGKKKEKPGNVAGKDKLSGFIPLTMNHPMRENFAEINLSSGAKIIFHAPVSAQYLRAILR